MKMWNIHSYIYSALSYFCLVFFLSLFPPLAADSNDDDSDEDGDGSYLHPSLFAPKKCSRLEELVKVGYSASLNWLWPCGCLRGLHTISKIYHRCNINTCIIHIAESCCKCNKLNETSLHPQIIASLLHSTCLSDVFLMSRSPVV